MNRFALGVAAAALVAGLSGLFSGLSARREALSGEARLVSLEARISALSEADARLQQELRALHAQTRNSFRDATEEMGALRREQSALAAKWTAAVPPPPAPPAGPSEKGPGAAPPPGRSHTVAEGDTMLRIANQYGVALQALLRANPGVSPDRIRIGQRIALP